MARPNDLPSVNELRSLFICDPVTGELRFRGDRSRRYQHGGLAGSIKPDGYVRVGFTLSGKRRYAAAHRIVWAMCAGRVPLPTEVIDHANGNKSDNRIANLRLASPSQNAVNVRVPQSGIQHAGPKYTSRPFRARIMKDGRRVHLGNFATQVEAQSAYRTARRALFSEFAS
ncbi:MAG: HNH endonuclease [Hyphomonadaceae bacterium]|nr:HNH endonuclease [Hyphomonadaceae bacterium]